MTPLRIEPQGSPGQIRSILAGPGFFVGVAALLLAQVASNHSLLVLRGFVEDDFCWLEDARRTLDHIGHVLTLHISGFFRPMIHLAFAINYRIARLDARTYYAINLAIELVNTALVGLLARQLRLGRVPALASMLLFAAHSSHSAIVGWISARTTSIWALFGLLCLLCWVRYRQTSHLRWYPAALTAFVCALAAKEEAAALLPILCAVDWAIDSRETRQERRRRAIVLGFFPFALILAAYLALQLQYQSLNPLVMRRQFALTAAAPASLLGRAAGLYLQSRIRSAGTAAAYVALVAIGAALVLRRGRLETARVAWAAAAWMLIALAPTAFFETLFASRHSYFASIGAALLAAAMLDASIDALRRRPTGHANGIAQLDGGTGHRGADWFVVLLTVNFIFVVVITQHHRQRKDVLAWSERARFGQAVLDSLLNDAHPFTAATGPIVVMDSPMGLAHLRSAVWIARGIDPEWIIDAHEPGALNGPAPQRSVAVRWDSTQGRFTAD